MSRYIAMGMKQIIEAVVTNSSTCLFLLYNLCDFASFSSEMHIILIVNSLA